MPTMINDPVFGTLTWDWYWEGYKTISEVGEVRLVVGGSEVDAPEPAQHAAFRQLLQDARLFLSRAEVAIHGFYERTKTEYRELLSPTKASERIPELPDSTSIWRLLSGPRFEIPSQLDDQPRIIKMMWQCTWDDEHGVEVTFEDGLVTNVGPISG